MFGTSDLENAVDPNRFRAVMGVFPTGVTIVTTVDGGGVPRGYTAGSFVSVSLQPPLISVCTARSASCFPALAACDTFAVSVLRSEQAELARRFSSKGIDKFAGGGLTTSATGLPIVEGALAVVECLTYARHPAGDHVILVGAVRDARLGGGDPLVFHNRSFTRPITSPASP